jgi:hypothetical protein
MQAALNLQTEKKWVNSNDAENDLETTQKIAAAVSLKTST